MAKARMLHRSISASVQVSRLSLPAQLLFTWMIPHTDVEGKLKGDPKFVRGTVVPMLDWSINKVKRCIEEIADQGLIYYWEVDNEWIIEFVNFFRYQAVRKDHEKSSYLPSFNTKRDSRSTDRRQAEDVTKLTQSNVDESNPSESNKSEYSGRERKYEGEPNFVADEKYSDIPIVAPTTIDPRSFKPSSNDEHAALEAWKRLEQNNLFAFKATYLRAVKFSVPADKILQFASEIEQDSTIKNKGAVFNKKVGEYLAEQPRK